jgi:biopolymer transport protein ExbD
MRRLFHTKNTSGVGLQAAALAPMVDLFTILVVAVLRASSPEPPIEVPEPDFDIPLTVQEHPTMKGVIVDIGNNGIYVDGWRATSSEYWTNSNEVVISEVYTALQVRAESKLKIRADADVHWELVGKMLFTARQAGYQDIELIALSNTSL